MFRDVLAYVGDVKPATRLPAKDLSRSDGKHYTWDDYLAPDNLKVDLRRIGEDLDSEHLGRKCNTCWRGV